MPDDPKAWRNRSPGDLTVELPEIEAGDVEAAVRLSVRAFGAWRDAGFSKRKEALIQCREHLRERQEDLARLIALEVGKPLREARLELGAVLAKFDLTFEDADRFLADQKIEAGPHPALIRHRPRGPAAVIAPFNFPIHLGHGATVAYLLAGNTVLFKPSPLAAHVGAAYAAEMRKALPEGVFELVQGGGKVGHDLCVHPSVRSVCFTGSVPVGTALARELAADYSKSLALELGGMNSLIICADADLDLAAQAAADGICLTSGQRCNASSRILVDQEVEAAFLEKLQASLARYQPGDPLDEGTMLGPLVSEKAVSRYQEFQKLPAILPGEVCPMINGKRGYYVRPAVFRVSGDSIFDGQETFCPVSFVRPFSDLNEVHALHASSAYGLTASVFTRSASTFQAMAAVLETGNLYQNLPTTFSPSTLPFGGLRASGNGKPGGRGFIRFAADEQAVQWLDPK